MSDRLDVARIAAPFATRWIGTEIRYLEETTSTNDVAADFARANASGGLVIFAERQTKGRGRHGRPWDSSPGRGLWFSILLRPGFATSRWARLTTFAAVAVAEAVESISGVPAWIKWPNDVYLEGKKACGILSESSLDYGGYVVIGIGLNVNHQAFVAPLDETATSIAMVTGREIEREVVAIEVLQRMNALYPLVDTGFDQIIEKAGGRAFLAGRPIEWRADGQVWSGVAEGLDAEGGLIVRTSDGTSLVLSSGEVTLGFQRT